MRKARINPCERKGEVMTFVTSPTSYRTGSYLRYAPCECVRAWREMGPDGKALRYAVRKREGGTIETFLVKDTRKLPDDALLTLPCGESFRHCDSKGTEACQVSRNGKPRFEGCQSVEEWLVENRLVRIWAIEKYSLQELLEDVIPDEDELREAPQSKAFYSTFARAIAAEDEINIEDRRWSATKSAAQALSLQTSFAEMVGHGPRNFREVQARRLLEDGYFAKDPKLHLTARLIAEGITQPDFIARVAPQVDYEEFKRYEGIVNSIITQRLPEKAKRFDKFLESLTDAQREAIDRVYLKNRERKTQAQIATELEISFDSLRERLEGAKKKLLETYPDLQPKKKKKRPRAKAADNAPIKDGEPPPLPADMVRVLRIDPKTGSRTELIVPKKSNGRVKLRPGVDRDKIRYQIRVRCPIPYPAI